MYTIQGSRYVSVARIVMLTFLLLAMSCPVVGLVVAIFIFSQVRIEVFGVGGSRLRRAATGQ